MGQLLPLPQTADHGHAPRLPPWSHGYSEGQGWALLTRAVRAPNHIVSQHQTALTKREALLAGQPPWVSETSAACRLASCPLP